MYGVSRWRLGEVTHEVKIQGETLAGSRAWRSWLRGKYAECVLER